MSDDLITDGIETCILSIVKQITSPGWMHETSSPTWCTGKTQRDRVEREVWGGIGMGNTCKPIAVSCQCMTKSTTNKKKKKEKNENAWGSFTTVHLEIHRNKQSCGTSSHRQPGPAIAWASVAPARGLHVSVDRPLLGCGLSDISPCRPSRTNKPYARCCHWTHQVIY